MIENKELLQAMLAFIGGVLLVIVIYPIDSKRHMTKALQAALDKMSVENIFQLIAIF